MKSLNKTREDLRQAATIINDGGVILWPSCGVYGLACHAQNRKAVERIYSMKTRERNKPLPVLTNRHSAKEHGGIDDLAKALIERYWPGFLGLVVPKKASIPDFVTANRQSVAMVCPNQLVADLSDLVGGPIAATSANISGQAEVLDPLEATLYFEGAVDAIIEGPKLPGVLNTLLDLTQSPPTIVREGGVSVKELEAVLQDIKQNGNHYPLR